MKNYRYFVWFSNGSYEPECVCVFAGNVDSAIILAKAERIKKGLDHTAIDVEKEED